MEKQFKFISYADNAYTVKNNDATVDLFFTGLPEKEYDIIGDIQGYVVYENELRPMLDAKVRQVGGNGLMNIETLKML